MKSLLSTNKRKDMGIFKILTLFLKIWKISIIKRADRIGDKADPWPTPIFVLNKEEMKPFYKYFSTH